MCTCTEHGSLLETFSAPRAGDLKTGPKSPISVGDTEFGIRRGHKKVKKYTHTHTKKEEKNGIKTKSCLNVNNNLNKFFTTVN